MFTNLALELSPVVAGDVLSVLFGVALGLDPILQTLEVDQTDGASALARQNKRVGVVLLRTPTKPTVNLLLRTPTHRQRRKAFRDLLEIGGSLDGLCFFQLLCVEFLRR